MDELKIKLFALLLLSGICIAQSNPTTFTNSNLPKPEPQSSNFYFYMVNEDGHWLSTPCEFSSNGCTIAFGQPFLYVTLPDIPNGSNENTIACTIQKTVVTGTYGCQTAKCQSVTYTATADTDPDNDTSTCKDANGHVWTVVTTQYYHWRHSGLRNIQHYDGGFGKLSY